jgi:hypothetical protein
MDRLRAARLPLHTMFVSHLKAEELARLQQQFPQTRFRARIGTRLWLGDHEATEYRGAVLDVTRVSKGDRFGYRQQKVASDGWLVVVAGGTSHGVGLEAPKALHGVMPRAKGVARAGLATVNRNLSPFVWGGKQRWFAEPPHMQVSILFVPADARSRRSARSWWPICGTPPRSSTASSSADSGATPSPRTQAKGRTRTPRVRPFTWLTRTLFAQGERRSVDSSPPPHSTYGPSKCAACRGGWAAAPRTNTSSAPSSTRPRDRRQPVRRTTSRSGMRMSRTITAHRYSVPSRCTAMAS